MVMFALLIAVPGDAFAQKRGGRRPSRPAAKRKAAPAKRKAAPKRGDKTGGATKKKDWGSKKKTSSKKKPTKADQKAYDRAKANGTTFKDRKSAAASFKKKNAAKYGSTYATKPATRPGHIPPTYVGSGGTTYNISYNQGHGGYGYMNSLGAFIVYNAMADIAMAPYYNRQMASAGYMYGPRPVVGIGGGMIVLGVLGGFAVIIFLGAVLSRKGTA